MLNPYMNAWASVLNIVNKFVENNPQYAGMTIMDFEGNVDQDEYPEGTLGGIYQFEYLEKGSLIYIQVVFPFSVDSNSDMTKLNDLVGAFAAYIRNESKHPYFHYQSKAPIGLLVARDELEVSPLGKTTNRQFKFVAQGFIVDRTATFSPT
jgi:hypothetical protein